jgi:SAM-dependent methyltransferase
MIDRFEEIFRAKSSGPLLPPALRVRVGGAVYADWRCQQDADLSYLRTGSVQALCLNCQLPDRRASLALFREAWRVLEPGGVLMVSVFDLDAAVDLMKVSERDEQISLVGALAGSPSLWTASVAAVCFQAVGFHNTRRLDDFKIFAPDPIKFHDKRLTAYLLADR